LTHEIKLLGKPRIKQRGRRCATRKSDGVADFSLSAHPVGIGSVAAVALGAGLLAWGLLAVLERATRRSRVT
jgi:hypothetical protein